MSKLSEQLEFVWKINESNLNKLSNSMISSSLTYIPNKLKMNKIWIFNIRLNYNHSYKVRKQRNERVLTLIYGLWCKWLRCGGMHDAWCMMHEGMVCDFVLTESGRLEDARPNLSCFGVWFMRAGWAWIN